MDPTLESKTRHLVRMVFQDVFANLHSNTSVWASTPTSSVDGWQIPLGESNGGTIQLVSVGIETFGRALLGYTNQEGVSRKSFSEFMDAYFPPAYRGKATEVYSCYRCGLLHSHYLGFGSDSGFFPTRSGRMLNDKHLQYTNLQGVRAAPSKTSEFNRLILNLETFVADFKSAVESYLSDLRMGGTKQLKSGLSIDLVKNLEQSLQSFPEEDSEVLSTRNPPGLGAGKLGDVAASARQDPPGGTPEGKG